MLIAPICRARDVAEGVHGSVAGRCVVSLFERLTRCDRAGLHSEGTFFTLQWGCSVAGKRACDSLVAVSTYCTGCCGGCLAEGCDMASLYVMVKVGLLAKGCGIVRFANTMQ